MAVSLLQITSQNDNNVGTTSAVGLSATSGGTLLVLSIVWTPRVNNVSITDSAGNTWLTAIPKFTNNGAELSNGALFYVPNSLSTLGINIVTVNYSAIGNFGVWTVAEFSSAVASAWALDKTHTAFDAGAGTAVSSGATATLTQADELILGFSGTVRNNEIFTAGSGFTIPAGGSTSANAQAEAMEWLESASTAAQTATMTFGTNSTWNAGIATFIPPGSPTTPATPAMPSIFIQSDGIFWKAQ